MLPLRNRDAWRVTSQATSGRNPTHPKSQHRALIPSILARDPRRRSTPPTASPPAQRSLRAVATLALCGSLRPGR
eukprot:283349-Chlamydomonas_euryale.AAC.1